jgi:hypothetical protein
MRYSGARGTLIYEKNLKSKISCQTPCTCSIFQLHECCQYVAPCFSNIYAVVYNYVFPKVARPECNFSSENIFFVYFFGGLECVGQSFAYVAHFWFWSENIFHKALCLKVENLIFPETTFIFIKKQYLRVSQSSTTSYTALFNVLQCYVFPRLQVIHNPKTGFQIRIHLYTDPDPDSNPALSNVLDPYPDNEVQRATFSKKIQNIFNFYCSFPRKKMRKRSFVRLFFSFFSKFEDHFNSWIWIRI